MVGLILLFVYMWLLTMHGWQVFIDILGKELGRDLHLGHAAVDPADVLDLPA